MPNLANVTGPVLYDWNPASVAPEFSVQLGSTSRDDGSIYVMAIPRGGESWPAGVVLTAAATLPGTFKHPTLSPVGVGRVLFYFTPSGPGSGAFTITASGPGITSVSTTTPTPTPTPTPAPAPTVTVTNIALAPASSITANSPIETVVGTLSTQASGGSLVNPILNLVNTAGGNFKLVGSQVRFAVGNVSQGSFVIRARVTSNNAAAFEKDLAITVAAAAAPGTQGNSSVTLNGVPSTIVAGQLLSGVTFSAPSATVYFVLYKAAGAVEEGARWASGTLQGNLTVLVPQTAGAYTVRVYDAQTGGNLLFETTQISVTAAPGALPAQVTQTADTGATQTGVTMNWISTAVSYRFLARPGAGSAYGSLTDATVSTNSYTFTGLTSFSPRAIIIPQNANGFGPPSGQFISSTSF